MCRSSADGGRRCSGSSGHRTRALNTANKQVERAQNAVKAARKAGDTTAEAAAQARLDAARERLAATHESHPLDPHAGIASPAGQHGDTTPGEDTVDSSESHEDTTAAEETRSTRHTLPGGTTFTNVNYAAPGATVGLQANVVNGGTVFMFGKSSTVSSGADVPDHIKRATEKARQTAERARAAAHSGRATVHHSDDHQPDTPPDGSRTVRNVAEGDDVVAFQVGINLGRRR